MSAIADLDLVRAYAEGRLAGRERAAFEARLVADPALSGLVERYAEVASWETPPVPATSLRFEDLRLDAPARNVIGPIWVRRLAVAAAVLALLGGAVFATVKLFGVHGHRDSFYLMAIRPPPRDALPAARSAPVSVPALAETYVPVVDLKLAFVESYVAARDVAAATGRPMFVFIHFPGCPMCADLEKNAFRDERVRSAAADFVLAKVSAQSIPKELGVDDLDSWPMFALFDAPARRVEEREHRPRIEVVDATGRRVDVFGGMLEPEDFAKRLAAARASHPPPDANWDRVHAAARAIRAADAATTEGARYAALEKVELEGLSNVLYSAVKARREAISRAATDALVAAKGTAERDGIDAALAALSAASSRFKGSPAAADFELVRAKAAADREFPRMDNWPR